MSRRGSGEKIRRAAGPFARSSDFSYWFSEATWVYVFFLFFLDKPKYYGSAVTLKYKERIET